MTAAISDGGRTRMAAKWRNALLDVSAHTEILLLYQALNKHWLSESEEWKKQLHDLPHTKPTQCAEVYKIATRTSGSESEIIRRGGYVP